MSDIDPKNPRRDPEQGRQLEYLKTMQRMLDNNRPEPMQNPEQFRRNLVVAVLLTAALIGLVIWIIY
jgi:hypothetical protein